MSGPVAKSLVLSDHERAVLAGWIRRPTSAARLVQRARIVVAYADSGSVTDVARQVGVSAPTVSKWRDRFLSDRLDGLDDAPRPGQPRKLTDEQINALITRTLQDAPPSGDTHWSTRSMAADQGLNQTQVSRIWRAFGLKPHAVDSWKLSKDPDFVDKVRDIVKLYLSPPDNALVLAVDEKSQVQALDRTAPILPMMPGTPARPTRDYVRHGATTLFADGHHLGVCHRAELPSPSQCRVPALPQGSRGGHPPGTGPAPRARQLRHSQDPDGQSVVAQAESAWVLCRFRASPAAGCGGGGDVPRCPLKTSQNVPRGSVRR